MTLHDMEAGGNQVATQTTHDGGQFYFNNTTVPGGLKYSHPYEIRMDTTQLSLLDITLAGAKPLAPSGGRLATRTAGARQGTATPKRYYTLSPANRTGFSDPDLRDSDAQLVGGSAVIAVATLDAGQNDFTNDLSIYSCPSLTNEKDTVALCSGIPLDSVAAVGRYVSRVDSVQFVLFSSPQSGTAMYGSGGLVLGTVKPDTLTNRAVLYNPSINTTNHTAIVLEQYIYAIIYPTPENPACRQSDKTVLKLAPALSASAKGSQLTCFVEEITLTGQALYGDGTAVAKAIYAWTGPNSFTSLEQNPTVSTVGTYTLTVGDPVCPNAFTTATADVVSDTATPDMTTSVVAKTCPACKATMSVSAPGATFAWTGPNGFTGTGAVAEVTDDGEYAVTATGGNGCFIVESLQVRAFDCSPVHCLPLVISRVK